MVKLAILSFKFSLLSFLVEYKFDTFENSVGNLLIKLRRTGRKNCSQYDRKKRPEDNKLQRESKAEVKSSNTYYSEEEIEKHSH